MTDYGQELQFGVFITPAADQPDAVLELSQLADAVGLELVTFQDHPYQPGFLDTWTLLSVVAAQTQNVRVVPNVANLPLRDPFMLARSVATLDILSGGRTELGLGAGAFWEGIVAVGGRRLTPGQSVDALTEAIDVIRAVWSADGGVVRHDGEHYRVVGARPGPSPAHRVEIWLGAYKPRMLALTGRLADGWLPSQGYASPEELAGMQARIDEAAEAAGRSPSAVRRMYNVNGEFGSGGGFLQGNPGDWAEQLAELTLTQGISTYILAISQSDIARRFAEEVAPAVRERVEVERGRSQAAPPATRPAAFSSSGPQSAPATPLDVTPTPDDGVRLAAEPPWDESTRPAAPPPDPQRRYTPDQQAAAQHLIDVHDGLRSELQRLRQLLEQVSHGNTDPTAVRSFFNRMTIRQNNWTLGLFCESYCRAVTGHHTLEDRSVFPHLRSRDSELTAVLDRLGDEHETIAEILDHIDRALVSLVASETDAIDRVTAATDLLTDAMNSHLAYEERELVEPLARLGFY